VKEKMENVEGEGDGRSGGGDRGEDGGGDGEGTVNGKRQEERGRWEFIMDEVKKLKKAEKENMYNWEREGGEGEYHWER
jgi:hypothetical protein